MIRIFRSRPYIALILFLLIHAPAWLSAQHNNFRSWSVKEGLPQSDVYCISQDHRGYMWMGTGFGATSFDGKTFKTYTTRQGLTGNVVRSMLTDSKERIWFGSDGGVTVYDGFKFTSLGEKQGFKGTNALCILEDKNGTIWVGTDDGGLNTITLRSDSFLIEHFTDPSLEGLSIFEILQDRNGNLWIATLGGGVVKLEAQGTTYKTTSITRNNGLPSDMVVSLSFDHSGMLWVGTYDSGAAYLEFSDDGKTLRAVTAIGITEGLTSNVSWDILVDSKNEVWIGSTDKGVSRLQRNGEQWKIRNFTSAEGLPGNQVLSLFEDREKNIWIGTGGNGAAMLAGDHFSHYDDRDGLPGKKVQAVAQDLTGTYWLAMADGGIASLHLADDRAETRQYPEFQKDGNLLATCLATGNKLNQNIWIGTANGGLVKYDGKKFIRYTEPDGLLSNRVYSLFVDSKGIVWVGTSNGISRYDGVKFLNISSDVMKMKDQGVKTIIEDQKGNIWFGTAGGLARYSGDGILRTFDEVEGLMHIDVNSIATPNGRDIWIGTNTGGLYRHDPTRPDSASIVKVQGDSLLSTMSVRSLAFENDSVLIVGAFQGIDRVIVKNNKIATVKSFDATDGFIGVECNDNSILKDHNGHIWLGTVNGLTRVGSRELSSSSKPLVHINSIQLFFKDVDWRSRKAGLTAYSNLPAELVLDHDENHLTFHFTGLSFSNPDKLKYVYKLEGQDNDWSPIRSNNEVTFSGLGKGSYRFLVRAIDAEGRSSEPAVFEFTILAPWYQTTWFYLSVAVLLLASGFSYVKIRERKLVREKKVLEDIVTARTKEVVLQKEHIAEKNKEITDSINYAKRIQNAILPDLAEVKETFDQSFILFKPKDIVSGDFYWFMKEQNLIAAADCTGHGVPGAFMSTIGVEKLNETAGHTSSPGEILAGLNRAIKKSLNQSSESDVNEKASRDGMDIALLKIEQNGSGATLRYAAANRPLWILKKDSDSIEEIKATKTAIGGLTENDQEYTEHLISLDKGDTVYVFSDGYADQFSGSGKKLMTKKFKQILIDNQKLPMTDQRNYLDDFIETWKDGAEQTDDILVIGIRI